MLNPPTQTEYYQLQCGELRSKLSAVEKRLAAAEASSTSCTEEAGGLKSKLEQVHTSRGLWAVDAGRYCSAAL